MIVVAILFVISLPILLTVSALEGLRLFLVYLILGFLFLGLDRIQHLLSLLLGHIWVLTTLTLVLVLVPVVLILILLVLVFVLILVLIVLTLILVLILILVFILIVVLIVVLVVLVLLIILVLLVILIILVLVILTATTVLILFLRDMLFGIEIILLGVSVARIDLQALLILFHRLFPLLLLREDVAVVVMDIGFHAFVSSLEELGVAENLLHRPGGILVFIQAVLRARQVVQRCQRERVLFYCILERTGRLLELILGVALVSRAYFLPCDLSRKARRKKKQTAY